MRDIKFRAYDTVLGMRPVHEVAGEGSWWTIRTNDGTYTMNNDGLMQFTGVLDDDGQEIYEGDFIGLYAFDYETEERTDLLRRRVVEFKDGGFIVHDDFGDYDMTTIGWAIDNWDNEGVSYRVIGNIYENPELLKGDEPQDGKTSEG